jgi:hypothetical protein
MSEPVDLMARRRAVLQARVDREQRLLAEAEADVRDNATSVCDLRAFASRKDVDSDQARAAAEFADQIERGDAAMLAAVRADCAARIKAARAELDRLAGADG